MSVIEMKHITKVYNDGFKAVTDVNIDVADGEFLILVGPSGSGKSTLLRMIVGLEDITSGDLMIDGTKMNDKAPRDRNLSMVFQNYALYPHLTVFENIAFPLRLGKNKESEDKIKQMVGDIADSLELREHLDRKPANLSGGQRQRVAMGRAIIRSANGFLFDEPLSNLDAKLRGQMRTEIARLQRRLGITTVYVTHDQTEAMTLGDRVAVLRRGVLQQVASPRELYEQPVNLFVAGFIGSPPMNFLPATVGDGVLEMPFVNLPLPEAVANGNKNKGDLVIVGVRPEAFEDAALVEEAHKHEGVTFTAPVDVTEWLGNEKYAYLPFEPHKDVQAALNELDRELDGEALRTQLVVSLDGSSKIRQGDDAELWLNPDSIHVFDADSGDNLTRSESKAQEIAAESEEDRKRELARAQEKEPLKV
ncbi:ABC transporter ATP-binding protein [uncultured Jatrophihabitans sp.]|uniref:ABC transporter ATP-binding protein n=1 Tax=uncultured Jatrophihabitans sp. TaxID=1610747 RepID=UPI0035C968CB